MNVLAHKGTGVVIEVTRDRGQAIRQNPTNHELPRDVDLHPAAGSQPKGDNYQNAQDEEVLATKTMIESTRAE
jgi:hypothetical protein